MKRLILLAVSIVALGAPAFGQLSGEPETKPTSLVHVYPLGPLVGLYTAGFETVMSDQATFVLRPAYSNPHLALLPGLADALYGVEGLDHADYNAWRLSIHAGVSYFPGGWAPSGFFLGGAAQLGYLTVRDERTTPVQTESTILAGASVHLGYRWTWLGVAIAPRASLGYAFGFDDLQSRISEKRLRDYGRGVDWDLGVEVSVTF